MNNNGEIIQAPMPVESPEPPTPEALAEHDQEPSEDADAVASLRQQGRHSPPESDLTPRDGDVLEAGDYLIELETQKACPREILTEGFRRMGFSEVLVDQSAPASKDAFRKPLVREHRLVGRLTNPITTHQQRSNVRLTYARRLQTDILSELKLKFVDHPLTSGKIYESRFLSRMRSQPTRPMVEADLKEMGWEVLKLSALRRDMRIPGRDNASVTLWFAVLRWSEVDSYVSEDDPFYFEDVFLSTSEASPASARIGDVPSPNPSRPT